MHSGVSGKPFWHVDSSKEKHERETENKEGKGIVLIS
jgi:hypothetical protein